MNRHVTLHLHAHNEHAVLQRVLLAFSRRRLRIDALQMFDLHPDRPAEIQIDLRCDEATRADLHKQLARVVEVEQIWSEAVDARSADTPPLRVA